MLKWWFSYKNKSLVSFYENNCSDTSSPLFYLLSQVSFPSQLLLRVLRVISLRTDAIISFSAFLFLINTWSTKILRGLLHILRVGRFYEQCATKDKCICLHLISYSSWVWSEEVASSACLNLSADYTKSMAWPLFIMRFLLRKTQKQSRSLEMAKLFLIKWDNFVQWGRAL